MKKTKPSNDYLLLISYILVSFLSGVILIAILVSEEMTSEQTRNAWWTGIAALIIGGSVLFYFGNKKRPEPEDYKTRIPNKSGRLMGLARTMDNNGAHALDSKPFLEAHGFIVLGLIDEMLYAVEPPEGWSERGLNHLYSHILNEKGEQIFIHFRKNDIGNMSDYRANLREVQKENDNQ